MLPKNSISFGTSPFLTSSPIIIYLADGLGNPLSEKYQEIRVNYWNWTYVNPNDTYMAYTTDEIPLEPCDFNEHMGKFRNFFELSGYCPHFIYQLHVCFYG